MSAFNREPMPPKIIDYCSAKKGTTIDFPFDEKVMVFKVMGKMFALINVESLTFINLKCDSEYALVLRQQYPEVIKPGYHMNKKHWNSVHFGAGIDEQKIFGLIDHSWEMVVKGLKKSEREKLADK